MLADQPPSLRGRFAAPKHQLLKWLIRATNASVSGNGLAQKITYNASLLGLRSLFSQVRCIDAHGNELILHPTDVIDRTIVSLGIWEPHVTEAMKEVLRPGQVFYDVGANIGYNSLLAARLVGPRGRVVSFEPNPAIAARLRKNVSLNDLSHIEIVEACVTPGDETEVSLFLPPRDLPNPGRASMVREDGFAEVRCRAVQIDRLVSEGAIPPPDVVKIDVEGFEVEVVQSMGRALREPSRSVTVLMEVTYVQGQPNDSLKLLHEWGFEVSSQSDAYTFHRNGLRYDQHDVVLTRR